MRKLTITILMGLLANVASADIVARYTMGKDTVVLSYRDTNHIRLDTSRGGYSLISGDQAVAVINQGDRQMVMDVDQMGAVLSAMRNKPDQQRIPQQGDVTITGTGETRQIAGIDGEVFVINDGRQDYSVVLTNDPTVVKAGEAMARFFRRFANAMNNEQGARLLALDNIYRSHSHRGLLQAQGLRLVAIGEEERPDEMYSAPASAISFSMPGLLGGNR